MKFMKLAIIAAAVIGLAACDRVEPGHVGIKVNNFGSDAGVNDRALGVGYYYAGPGISIYEYPIYTNTYNWTKDQAESGKAADQGLVFQDKNGLILGADVAVAYKVNPEKAPVLFQKYRTDMDGIVAGPMRNAVRSAIVNESGKYSVDEVYGPRKMDIINAALADVQKYFSPFGLEIEQMYWASPIRMPKPVEEKIILKNANEQEALAAVAAVATAEANANAAIKTAEGRARAIMLEGDAIAKSPGILQMRAIEKWDQHLPTTMIPNSALPFIGNVTPNTNLVAPSK